MLGGAKAIGAGVAKGASGLLKASVGAGGKVIENVFAGANRAIDKFDPFGKPSNPPQAGKSGNTTIVVPPHRQPFDLLPTNKTNGVGAGLSGMLPLIAIAGVALLFILRR